MTPIEKARANLAALEQEWQDLESELRALEARQKAIEDRRRKLNGQAYYGMGRGGQIKDARDKLELLELQEEDVAQPTVFFLKPTDYSGFDDVTRWVVDRVTEKRIFIREAGKHRTEQFTIDGVGVCWKNDRIDLAKTFPTGLPVVKKKARPR